jgi:molybdopterin converting factor small subunit
MVVDRSQQLEGEIMQIFIRLSSGLAEHVGQTRLLLILEEGATVADLRRYLGHQYENLAQPLATAIPVVAGRHVTDAEMLREGQEVSLLLPIAGG